MCLAWSCTVCGERHSRSAAASSVIPSAKSNATSACRPDRPRRPRRSVTRGAATTGCRVINDVSAPDVVGSAVGCRLSAVGCRLSTACLPYGLFAFRSGAVCAAPSRPSPDMGVRRPPSVTNSWEKVIPRTDWSCRPVLTPRPRLSPSAPPIPFIRVHRGPDASRKEGCRTPHSERFAYHRSTTARQSATVLQRMNSAFTCSPRG